MSHKVSDIRFYDFNFQLLHTENEFLSSNWTVYYNDIGTFEAHFDLKSDALPVVMENDYLVVVQDSLSAIIVGKKAADELVLYGRTCNWLLTKRITNAFGSTTDAIDSLLKSKIEAAFSDSPLTLINTISNLPQITASRDDKCETFSFVQESLQLENLGHKLEFDPVNSRWVFKILRGNEDNPLVISNVNRNAYDVSAQSDLLKVCTQGWYKRKFQNMGEWDPQINALLDSDGKEVLGTAISNGTEASPIPSNFGKCWKVQFEQDSEFTAYRIFGMFLKAGDIVICDNENGILTKSDKADMFWAKTSMPAYNKGILRWECLLPGNSESAALSALYNMQIANKIQGKTVGIHFGSYEDYLCNRCDYTLGDVIFVEWQSGDYKKRTRKRIVGVNIWYEPKNIGEEPIFEDVN